jgi:N6-L-threonylcarbamoyladenine synthase
MKLLAIETSCDDTGISILEAKKDGSKTKFKILGNEVSSQISIHIPYGGVFPALAKREHIKNLPLVFEKVLKEAKIEKNDIKKKIDAIAVTTGPGLEPALWTGIVFAKELSQKYKIPIIPVNHMEGHIFSIFPKKGKTFTIDSDKKIFPVLSLLVSGGHTELVLMKDWMKYKKIGQTRDDAAGEAFDKVARMLLLPYPGGPEISKLASMERKNSALGELESATARARGIFQQKNIRVSQGTILSDIVLPRPMMFTKDYDFSFSGLKTAVLYLIRDMKEKNPNILDDIKIRQQISCEFENAVVETLAHKTVKAIKQYKIKTLIVGGGVSANTYLQEQLKGKIKKEKLKTKVHFPTRKLSGDNALMIAIAGYFQYKNKKFVKTGKSLKLKANGNMSL